MSRGGRALGAARPLNDPLYLALVGTDVLRQVIAKGVPGTAMPAFAEHAGGSSRTQQIDILVTGMQITWGRPSEFRMWRCRPTASRCHYSGSGPVTRSVARRFTAPTVRSVTGRMARRRPEGRLHR